MIQPLLLSHRSLGIGGLLMLLSTLTTAQVPGPDSTFGRFGAAWRNIYPTDDQAFAVALHPDGRAVVAGRTTVDSVPQMAVFQYKTDGSLDLDFHWNGKGALTFNASPSAAHAVAVDADGRTVLAGYVTTVGSEQFGLVRLLPDGSYDPNFGNKGWATTDFNSSSWNDQANAVAIQPDGKIVAAGFTRNGTDADFALARYLPDGSLDATFGTGGRVVTKIDALADIIRDIVVQSNGKIIVCGTTVASQVFNTPSFFAVARYLPDGSLDPTFGGVGNVITDVGADEESDIARAVALLPTGQIVVTGYSSIALASKISVVRYRPNGLLDATFGTLGVAQTEVFANSGNFCTDLTALPDNSLLLSGMAENVDFKDVFLIKMQATGTLDPAFGQNGKIVRSLSPKDDNSYGMARRPDGRILVVGDTRKDSDFYTDATALQFNANGSADAAFGSGGAVVGDVGTSEDNGSAVLLQPDGKIVAGGRCGNEAYRNDWALLRFLPNGQPDQTFGTLGGATVFVPTVQDNYLNALLRQPDGKILVAGSSATQALLARFNPDGSPDANFGQAGKVTLGSGISLGFESMVLQSDGAVLAAGTEWSTGLIQTGVVARFLPNGTLDASFGQLGRANASGMQWYKLLQQPDGKLLAVGNLQVASPILPRMALRRYESNGDPDPSFDFQYAGPTPLTALSAALQSDGKIVVTGHSGGMYMAYRLLPNGKPDPAFGNNGLLLISKGNSPHLLTDILIQADKRILLMGGDDQLAASSAPTKGFVVIRLHANGSLDNTWGQGGYLALRGLYANSAAFDADGNILAVGGISNGEGSDIVVYRLLRGEYVGTIDRPDEAGSRILNVFPNPVSEQLTLEYDLIDNQEVSIKMYDTGGRLLHTLLPAASRFSGKNTERIALPAGLPAGMYAVTVETGRGSVAVQVVVR